jgi:arabinogalactan endo-1,4-beta-galactosidase
MNGHPRRSTRGDAPLLLIMSAAFTLSSCGSGGGSGGPPPPPPVAPTITTQPSSPTVKPGQTATFTVVATGTASLSYQWQKAGVNISGATSASYTTPATTAVDNGSQFDVLVSNSAGSVTSILATLNVTSATQQPPEPVDMTPIDGEAYYVLNQFSGLQADLINNSQTAGDHVVQASRTFTDLSQRWGFNKLSGGLWKISNLENGFCTDSATSAGVTWVVQNTCTSGASSQQWTLTPAGGGYYTISNHSSGLLVDVYQGSTSAGASLDETALSGSPNQSQLWLLRPAFFRGVDNALLEKQEAARAKEGLVWWNDAGVAGDVLQILKNHGVNMIRLRPTSMPPYATQSSQPPCVQNLCYAETETQDLDLAKRAKNLGMSVELTLLFDGGASVSVPASWSNDALSQLQTDLYNYVKAEILAYRQAGTMPDLVSIGNEVDTGFLGPTGSPTGSSFGNFATLQKQAMQAVSDAAADTSIGPAIPPPLTCIHITPAWDLTQFFTLANQNGIPYDAICHSYYPIFHGPLTDAQATASNPSGKPVEQDVLVAAANNLGKPIFIIETGEHYENGFQSNDPWYSPPSQTEQRQFLIDLQNVEEGLPNNLGMGLEYWDPAGVNIPSFTGGFLNGDSLPDAIYIWNGLTLFDNADMKGITDVTAPNYSELLPGIDGLGGAVDSALSYKIVNRATGRVLAVSDGRASADSTANSTIDDANPSANQRWRITSNKDGSVQIASMSQGTGNAEKILGVNAGGNIIVESAAGSIQQEWNIVSAGNGYFRIVSRRTGRALDAGGTSGQQTSSRVHEPRTAHPQTQQWRIVRVR